MKRAAPVTTLFLDVGGVLLTNGWDHHARRRAARHFKLAWAEMEERHSLVFETHEEGRMTFQEYLGWVVFYQKRPFTRSQFRDFIFAQSKPYPGVIELIANLKARYGLKIVVVSNESREVNAYRIRAFKLDRLVDTFLSSSLRSSAQARCRYLSAGIGSRPGATGADHLHRQHADVRPGRGRAGHSQHSSCGFEIHPRKASFIWISRRDEVSSPEPLAY